LTFFYELITKSIISTFIKRERSGERVMETQAESRQTTLPRTLQELIATNDKPVLIDFWAEWCAPCRMVAPVVKEIAKAFAGRITVVKINIDEKPALADEYGIRSIPTLMIAYRGKTLWRGAGAMGFEALRNEVERALANA
jgi:thioredoxin